MPSPELTSLPSVIRPVSDYHRDQIQGLTEHLHRRNGLFIPSEDTAYDVNLLRTDDVVYAIKKSEPGSQIKNLSSQELMTIISEGMQSLDSFNQPLNVEISSINMPSRNRFNQIVVLSLSDSKVTAERFKGISTISEAAEIVLRTGIVSILLGKLRSSPDPDNSKKFHKVAKGIMSSDKYDLKTISLMPGIVNLSKPTSIK